MTKLSELKAGDILTAGKTFTCMRPGSKLVLADEEGLLYVDCDQDRHYLDGQTDDDGDTLIGLVCEAK
jgi:hypothetical protein